MLRAPKGASRNFLMLIHSVFSCFTKTIWVNESGNETGGTWQRDIRQVGQEWLSDGDNLGNNSSITNVTVVTEPRRARSLDLLANSTPFSH